MSESTAETSTETTTETSETDQSAALAEIKSLADEFGVTPAQLKQKIEHARRWEKRAKENSTAAQELESLRQSQMTEQERAVADAVAAARTETLREIGAHLVIAEFRAQAAGRLTPEQVAELVEDLDMSKYLTDSGEVDAERVTKKVAALAPQPTEPTAPTWPDLGQGARDSSTLALNSDGLTDALMRKVGAKRN